MRRRRVQAMRVRDKFGEGGANALEEPLSAPRAATTTTTTTTTTTVAAASSAPAPPMDQPAASAPVPLVAAATPSARPNIPSSRSAATNLSSPAVYQNNRDNTAIGKTPTHLSAPGGVLRPTDTMVENDAATTVSVATAKSSIAFDVEFHVEEPASSYFSHPQARNPVSPGEKRPPPTRVAERRRKQEQEQPLQGQDSGGDGLDNSSVTTSRQEQRRIKVLAEVEARDKGRKERLRRAPPIERGEGTVNSRPKARPR